MFTLIIMSYQGCPLLMQDGRQFTNYRSSNWLYNDLKIRNGIRDNQMKLFLQNNGNTLAAQMRYDATRSMYCPNTNYIDNKQLQWYI